MGVYVGAWSALRGELIQAQPDQDKHTPRGSIILIRFKRFREMCSEGTVCLNSTPSHLILPNLNQQREWDLFLSYFTPEMRENKHRNVAEWGLGKYYAILRLCQSDWNVKDNLSLNKPKFVFSCPETFTGISIWPGWMKGRLQGPSVAPCFCKYVKGWKVELLLSTVFTHSLKRWAIVTFMLAGGFCCL